MGSIANLLAFTLRAGQRVLLCPESAVEVEAWHTARFLNEQFGEQQSHGPAIALTTDPTLFDEVGRGWSAEEVLAKQVHSLAERGDLLVALSPGEPSDELLAAVVAGRAKRLSCVAILGPRGTALVRRMEASLMVPETIPDPALLRCRAWELIAQVAANVIRDRTKL